MMFYLHFIYKTLSNNLININVFRRRHKKSRQEDGKTI